MSGVRLELHGLDRIQRQLEDLARSGPARAAAHMDEHLAAGFAATQAAVHTRTNATRESGTVESTFTGTEWLGSVEYGIAGPVGRARHRRGLGNRKGRRPRLPPAAGRHQRTDRRGAERLLQRGIRGMSDDFSEVVRDLPTITCEVVGTPHGYRATARFADKTYVAIDEDLEWASYLATAGLEALIGSSRD